MKFEGILTFSKTDLRQHLENWIVRGDAVFIKVDIADYFLSGRSYEVVESSAQLIDDPEKREQYKSLAELILYAQYVKLGESQYRATVQAWASAARAKSQTHPSHS